MMIKDADVKQAILISHTAHGCQDCLVPYFVPNISFDEHKTIFFVLIDEWLNDDKIKFDYPPLEKYADKTGFWDADNTTIMVYLKDDFPKHATHEHDMDVNLYFYEIAPPVCWP